MMVMRVLPGEGTTAPRLPRLKSYSLRMVVLRRAKTCFARGNDPDPIAARGVNNDKNSTQSIHAQRHQARLTFRVRVSNSDGVLIAKRLLRMGKADAMLAKVGLRFVWVEFDRQEERSEEHTSELQSLMRISYAVFCLKNKKT